MRRPLGIRFPATCREAKYYVSTTGTGKYRIHELYAALSVISDNGMWYRFY
jgi:hypothetical protein